MTPFVAAQVHSLIEDIRLLEALVTAPLGLCSDIRMLRQAMPDPEAADLERQEEQRRRAGYRGLSGKSIEVALATIGHIKSTVAVLDKVTGGTERPFTPQWSAQAGRVLARAEERVASELRADTVSMVKGLYVIVDPEATRGRPVPDVAEAALNGGAGVIQLRDKVNDSGEVLRVARQMRAMCEQHGALFIMNDDPALALSSRAHGLHLGQTDVPAPEARRVLMPTQILGLSNNTMEEVARSQALGADYLAVGAVYPTSTMGKSERPAVGVEMIREAKEAASQPIVAIGGIDRSNIVEVATAGADCVCVVSAVTLADDPESAARSLVDGWVGSARRR